MMSQTSPKEGRIMCQSVKYISAAIVMLASPVLAQEDADLAKQLTNPVADLISVPIQLNYDENMSTDGRGDMLRINIQPVAPFFVSATFIQPFVAYVTDSKTTYFFEYRVNL